MTEFEAKMLSKVETLNGNIETLAKNIEALLVHYILEDQDNNKITKDRAA